jgi:hypothetical protein
VTQMVEPLGESTVLIALLLLRYNSLKSLE